MKNNDEPNKNEIRVVREGQPDTGPQIKGNKTRLNLLFGETSM